MVMFKDMGIDLSCVVEVECEVEVGKMIGAKLVVLGGLVKMDDLWVCMFKLYDIEFVVLFEMEVLCVIGMVDLLDKILLVVVCLMCKVLGEVGLGVSV